MIGRLAKWSLVMLLVGSLCACGNDSKTDGAEEAAIVDNTETSATPGNTDTAATSDRGRPVNLPDDFPLPDDADIRMTHSEEAQGKKSALLIFATEESMERVTERYKAYFKERLGRNASQLIDDRNIVIQGESADGGQAWSLIGGPLASEEGTIELTVTWSEL